MLTEQTALLSVREKIVDYIKLTKPGIIWGNGITTVAGYFFAAKGDFKLGLFVAVITGLCLIVAAGCALNNYLDRKSDQKMARTAKRALAKGSIQPLHALIFAFVLLILGGTILAFYTNVLALVIALIGFVIYVVFYTFLKYQTIYATEIGSIAGAIPPVVGYCAVSGMLDLGALLLFIMIALWQMPHFFAIAIFRAKEYAQASIPVLPLVKGLAVTKFRMVLYTLAFVLSTLLPTFLGYTGNAYLTIVSCVGTTWFILCLKGIRTENHELWAYKVFRFSLLVVMILCLMVSITVL